MASYVGKNTNQQLGQRIKPVTIAQHENFGGKTAQLPTGRHGMSTLREHYGLPNDSITAIEVAEGWEAEIFQDEGFRGPSKVLGPGTYPALGERGWNDRISSIVVRQRGEKEGVPARQNGGDGQQTTRSAGFGSLQTLGIAAGGVALLGTFYGAYQLSQ